MGRMVNLWIQDGFISGAIVGFAWGTGLSLFGWMVRQVWGTFRKIILSACK